MFVFTLLFVLFFSSLHLFLLSFKCYFQHETTRHTMQRSCYSLIRCHLTTFDTINTNQNEVSTYGFETPRKSACRHLWRCCVEHHAFFRLVRVSPMHDAELFSLGSRFRYRYVKRNQFVKNFIWHTIFVPLTTGKRNLNLPVQPKIKKTYT